MFGLINDNLKERLLREPNFDLTRALEIAQRSKASKLQLKEMGARPTIVNALWRNKPQQHVSSPDSQRVTYCGQCGCQHQARECPAHGQQCSYCHKLNHYARMCCSRQKTRSQGTTHMQSRRNTHHKVQEVIQSDSSLRTSTEESPDLFIERILDKGLKKSTACTHWW